MSATSNAIIERLRNHQCHPDTYPKSRRAAVLICLIPGPSADLSVLLTLRSSTLRSHPNEVALPGGNAQQELSKFIVHKLTKLWRLLGRADDTDESLIATAFREAEEEIGLYPSQHTYITTLHPFVSLHLLIVTPIVSVMNADAAFVAKMNPDEVSAVFTLPLSRFLSSYNYSYRDVAWYEQMWRHHSYGVPHLPNVTNAQEYPVTGFTAAVLLHCAMIGIGSEGSDLQEYGDMEPEEGKSWEDIFINFLVDSGEFKRRHRNKRRTSTRRPTKHQPKRESRSKKSPEQSNSRI